MSMFIQEGLSEAYRCVHCGFCLITCPTYKVTGNEADSPRGRIYLVKALLTNRVSLNDTLMEHLDRCIICRRCETACPSGVRYSSIMWAAYAYSKGRLTRYGYPISARLGLRLMRRPLAMRMILRLSRLLPAPNHLRGFSRTMGGEKLDLIGKLFKPPGETRGRVILFTTPRCVVWQSYARIIHATVRVLTWNGFEVAVPRGFDCCGAPHMHMGLLNYAKELARRNVKILEKFDVDYVVIPDSGGCEAQWLEYDELRQDLLVTDTASLLDRYGLVGKLGPVYAKVLVQHSCHLMNVAKSHESVLRVLRRIPQLVIRPLSTADICCGGGMMYPDRHPSMAERIIRMKLEEIDTSGADYLVLESPSCMAHFSNYTNIKLLYPVELLDASYRSGGNDDYDNILTRSLRIS